MARAPTTSDVFNAVADVHRRDILDVLITGEKAVGTIVSDLPMFERAMNDRLDRIDHYLQELQGQQLRGQEERQ